MRKSLRWILILLAVAILVGIKLIFFTKKEEAAGSGKGKSRIQAPIAVNYYVVEPTVLSNSVYATGIVGAFRQVELIPEVSGKVMEINFTEGETVNKGSLLVKLNDQD